MNEKVKRTFEEPKVEKVEFDFKTRIAASSCGDDSRFSYNPADCLLND